MKQIPLTTLLLCLLLGFSLVHSPELSAREGREWARDWEAGAGNYAKTFEKAASSGEPVAVYIYTDWCPFCRRFEKEVLSSQQVQAFMKNKKKVFINPEKGSEESDIAQKYGVRDYPAFFVHVPKAKVLGKLKTFVSPSEFIHSFNQVASHKSE